MPACNKLQKVECWQINLHHCQAASYNLGGILKNVQTFIAMIQEPWIIANKIAGRIPNADMHVCNKASTSPRTCIYTSKNLETFKLDKFCSRDVVAIVVNGLKNYNKVVFSSVYMPHDDEVPPKNFKDLVEYCRNINIPLIVSCDANAHHTLWGSTNINERGRVLLDYLVGEDLNWCNLGSVPTFITSRRKEVLDLTLISANHDRMVKEWHVSDIPSFSDHRIIRYNIDITPQKRKLIRNVRTTNWLVYNDVLINESKNKPLHSGTNNSVLDAEAEWLTNCIGDAFKKATPLTSIEDNENKNEWWTSDLSASRKQVRKKLKVAILTNATQEWEAYREALKTLKKEIRKAKRSSWRNFCESIETEAASIKLIKALKKNQAMQLGSVSKEDGNLTATPEETLARMLEVHLGNPEIVEPSAAYPNIPEMDEALAGQIITNEKVKLAVNGFRPLKAPGAD